MMNVEQLNLFLNKIFVACDMSIDKANKLCTNLGRYTINDKIRIDNFAFDNELSQEQAETILDTLCDMQIMKKTERMYRCPKCGVLLGILTTWEEGDNFTCDNFTCDNCNTTHPYASVYDTETIYSLYIAPTLKIFKVTWKDERNGLTRHSDVIAYTQSDAESLIHEYYHYTRNSIKVSAGIELQNKMLLKEYN